MRRVAVTGGVATGKSTVLAALSKLGVPTIDLDEICRRLVEPGRPELARIQAEFGSEFVRAGRLDRPRLRDLISREVGARAHLNAILHPPAVAEMERRLAELAAAGHPLAAVEVPLLFEAGYADLFDAVIVAACPPELALARLAERSSLGPAEAQRLMAAQLPLEQKMARADFVVDTAGSRKDVAAQVEQILQRLQGAPPRQSRPEGGGQKA